jgi:hypothetical protein
MFNGLPVPIAVPPQLDVNQATCDPEPPLTLKSIVPESSEQKLFLSTLAEVGAVGAVTTVTVVL